MDYRMIHHVTGWRSFFLLPIIISLLVLGGCSSTDIDSMGTGTESSLNAQLQQSLLRGWNTWNNSSVLSHVLMPEGLSISVSFKKFNGGDQFLRTGHIANSSREFTETIIPRGHAYDGSYTELGLTWQGMEARIQTATDGDDLVILYTPVTIPAKPHYIVIETGILWNRPGELDLQGNTIRAEFARRTVTIGATAENAGQFLPLSAPYLSFASTEPMGVYTGKARTLAEIETLIEEKKAAHESRKEQYGDLAEAYNAMQTLLAWNTIYDVANNRTTTPVSRLWNDNWGGYILFDWDTYFTALMLALDHKELAYSNAIAITDAATERGFIPNVEASHGIKSYDRSQPPVGSIVCRLIYEKYGEKPFLEAVYDNLRSWNRWWDLARNNEGFLSWGSDPHPQGMDPHTKQAAKWESGLDNSPLFDEAVFNEDKNMLELASVGLMGMYVADCNDLAYIADELGHGDDADELRARGERYAAKLQELWDDETGIFRDRDLLTGQPSPHLAPTNFYPLIGRVPSQEQAERMIAGHYFNPAEFFGEWMLPSIARNDPGYPDMSYWRGRVWAPMNFLVYLGIRKYDLPDARRDIVDKSIHLLMKEWTENRRVYENYNANTGVGGDVRNSNDFYSWGALLGMIALMEQGYY